MSRERLKEIFIQEATEIIERLDMVIIDFEEEPANSELLNELFRNVHTLKGSANAFNFTRLGEFVHHFEDLLDMHRAGDQEVRSEMIDLFLNAVDIIKNTFEYETNDTEGVPQLYHETLMMIQQNLDLPAETPEHEPLSDLAAEFETDIGHEEQTNNRYMITMTLEEDAYFRGFDHMKLLKSLADIATIESTDILFGKIPKLKKFDPKHNYIKKVHVTCHSNVAQSEIEELFDFCEPDEWKIETHEISEPTATRLPQEETETVPEEPVPEATLKPADESENIEVRTKPEPAAKKSEKNFLKIESDKLDELFDSVGELVIAQNFLAESEKIKSLRDPEVSRSIETLSKITRLIQNRVMSLRMVPIRDTFAKMRRIVRDTAKKLDKEVKLTIVGEDTEIDKNMIDALSDPLVHILRNAVDHGLEMNAQERLENGKAVEGNIALKAFHKGGNIIIAIEDDGRGINRGKVLKKAIERGVITPHEAEGMSDGQVFALIMEAGFSTAETITDVSGRGVGLDVVRSAIEQLRGKVEIESKLGMGTSFSIVLPLTLAIIDGMLIESSGHTYIIPTLSITESFKPLASMCNTVQGKGEYVKLRQELLPVVRLNRALELDMKEPPVYESTLVCCENERGKFALLVDLIVGRRQVVIKSLGKSFSNTKEISGGAVLGNGEVALILNIEGLY